MSPSFSDGQRLKARAQKNLDDGLVQIKRWWTERFKLPPNHDLFSSVSLAEHTQEMYEDLMFRREEIQHSLEEHDGDQKMLMQQLAIVNKALGEKVSEDDLFDQWERDLEEGRVPDLDAMPGSD
jgi:hypothetical protein